MDAVLILVPKRIARMPKRRQKKAIAKLPRRVLTNFYPISPAEFEPFTGQALTVEYSFTFVEKYLKNGSKL